MSALLKKEVKTKLDDVYANIKAERKQKLITDKGAFVQLSSKGVAASILKGEGGGE